MEKRVVLAMGLSLCVLFVWAKFTAPPVDEATGRPPVVQPADGVPSNGVPPVDGRPGSGNGPNPGPGGADDPTSNGGVPVTSHSDGVPAVEVQDDVEVGNERVDWTLTQTGGGFSRIAVWGNPDADLDAKAVRSEDLHGDPGECTEFVPTAGALSLRLLRPAGADLAVLPWKIWTTDRGALVAEIVAYDLRIRRTVTPDPQAPFLSVVSVEVEALSLEAGGKQEKLEIAAPWLPVLTSPGYANEVLWKRPDDDEPDYDSASSVLDDLVENPFYEIPSAGSGWDWIGTRADFFLAALAPRPAAPQRGVSALPERTSVGFRARKVEVEGEEAPMVTAAPTYRMLVDVPPQGGIARYEFTLYTGPNSATLFGEPPYEAFASGVPTRWLSIGVIETMLSWLLRTLAGTGIGYGMAIIFLTVCVRGLLFPLSRKSQISMRIHAKRMAVIKPKMDAIKEKYKDSRKQQQKIMEMMRSEKMSFIPGGCLLAFVQMPIWISLYGLLGTTFELRYEGFLWFDNLTAADHLWSMPATEGWPIIDGWLNLLPIFMMITWGISARLQPLPVDPQQQQQAKMMRWMPMLFGVMLYQFSSGLCLYMTMSALWSIGEVQLIRRLWLNKIEIPGNS